MKRILFSTLVMALMLFFTTPRSGAGASSSASLSLSVTGSSANFSSYATAAITATAVDNGAPVAINPGDVTWMVVSSNITAAWWGNRSTGAMNGLAWGAPLSLKAVEAERTSVSGPAPTGDTARLTDIVGSRVVRVRASMNIGGTVHSQTIDVSFGKGPLSVFRNKPLGPMSWVKAGNACGAVDDPDALGPQDSTKSKGIPEGIPTHLGNLALKGSGYQNSTKLPTIDQLRNVAASNGSVGRGAAFAAGWPDDANGKGWFLYWTRGTDGFGRAMFMYLPSGGGPGGWLPVTTEDLVAVCVGRDPEDVF
ncbi:MAG: hypothetical protein FWH34_03120 [Desulfovibrionaceae bacterium]|nr:hypothetical protein [Desulfovibrionaceae bacterium]